MSLVRFRLWLSVVARQSLTYNAQIAQLVEQRTENPRVAGSIPALGTLIKHIFDIEMGLKIPLLRQECFGSGIFFIGNCVL